MHRVGWGEAGCETQNSGGEGQTDTQGSQDNRKRGLRGALAAVEVGNELGPLTLHLSGGWRGEQARDPEVILEHKACRLPASTAARRAFTRLALLPSVPQVG